MKQYPFFTNISVISSILFLAACAPAVPGPIPTTSAVAPGEIPNFIPTVTSLPATATPALTESQDAAGALVVAFVKDGNIHLWEEVTQQSRTLIRAGDVISVTMSDDGQVIAFQRRALVEQPELMEYVSLWAIDSNGQDPRELVSAESLRQRLQPAASDSASFAQISWIPGTHRLVYSGSKHYLPGQGFTQSTDIYLVDADTGSDIVLAPAVMPDTAYLNAWHFVISPDGGQIALISGTALNFINADGSNWRQAVLTYPQVGAGDAVLLPNGVWTQNSRAFIFTGPMPSESIHLLNYTIWLVPVDGSPAQSLGTLTDSHSSSVTFSPDGKQMAFLINQPPNYRIIPLAVEVGPLALPDSLELFYANLHWSPGGAAFVLRDRDLFQLCPGATQASEVCGEPIDLGKPDIISSIQWVGRNRFLFTSHEPATLSLGSLGGTVMPIFNASDGDWFSWDAVILR
jgi:dipeptidyl aminopeptidase/acylaminoacyl peptidase